MRQKPLWRCSLYYSGTDTAYKCEERTNYTFRPRGRRRGRLSPGRGGSSRGRRRRRRRRSLMMMAKSGWRMVGGASWDKREGGGEKRNSWFRRWSARRKKEASPTTSFPMQCCCRIRTKKLTRKRSWGCFKKCPSFTLGECLPGRKRLEAGKSFSCHSFDLLSEKRKR